MFRNQCIQCRRKKWFVRGRKMKGATINPAMPDITLNGVMCNQCFKLIKKQFNGQTSTI